MPSPFPKLFHEYYAIHETISRIIREGDAGTLDESEIERRVKATHPELEMGPAMLRGAIRRALKDTEATVGRPVPLSDDSQVAEH
jgi:hypothetical protein